MMYIKYLMFNIFLGIKAIGWIKLFKSLEGSWESKFEDL